MLPHVVLTLAALAAAVQEADSALIVGARPGLLRSDRVRDARYNEEISVLRRPDFDNHTLEHLALVDVEHDASSHILKEISLYFTVSPALRCVTFITVVFFGVYLAAVCARATRLASAWSGGTSRGLGCFEARLGQVTEAMTMAPMLCVLMISARLRALQLDPGSNPEWYVQSCMYTSAGAFFLRILLGLATAGESGASDAAGAWQRGATVAEGAAPQAAQVVYCLLSLTLYMASCSILVLGTLAEGDGTGRRGGSTTGPAISPMVRCIAALTATYLAEYALFEVLSGLRQHFRWSEIIKEKAAAGSADLAEQLGLRFPVMVCVLLVGIELRAVQLRLTPDPWMCFSMYMTVASVVAQAACAGVTATLRSVPHHGLAPAGMFQDRSSCGRESGRFFRGALMAMWALIILALYLGTASILISVVVMEEWPYGRPSGVIAQPLAFFGYHRRQLGEELHHLTYGSGLAETVLPAAPPLSTAMRCVLSLTVVYFATNLCLISANLVPGVVKRWAKSVLESVQGALAFVPMLCVMMIAVRLRAMQLRIRDPQEWAQTGMYAATIAVATQAVCSLGACASKETDEDDEFDECRPGSINLLGKVIVIILLAVRYLAAVVLYICVAALIVSLISMEPVLLPPGRG